MCLFVSSVFASPLPVGYMRHWTKLGIWNKIIHFLLNRCFGMRQFYAIPNNFNSKDYTKRKCVRGINGINGILTKKEENFVQYYNQIIYSVVVLFHIIGKCK